MKNKFKTLLPFVAVVWTPLLLNTVSFADHPFFLSDPSSDITRLSYYPHAGKFYAAPDFKYVPTDLSDPNIDGSPGNDGSAHSVELDWVLIYGLPFLEGLRFYYSQGWLLHRWTNTTNGNTGVVSQADSAGFSDPTLGLQYRIIDSAPMGFSWDGTFNVKPSWIQHNVATSMTQGSDASGFGSMTFATTGYWVSSFNDASVDLTLAQDFSGNNVNEQTPANSTTRTSVLQFSMTAADRVHLTQDFYWQGALVLNFPYTYTQTNQATNPVTTSNQYPLFLTPSLLVGYRVLENFTLDAMYTYQNYSAVTTASTATTGTQTQLIQNTLQFRARFQI